MSSRADLLRHAPLRLDARARLAVFALLLTGEALFVSLTYDAWGSAAAGAGWWLIALNYAGYALKALIAFIVAMLLAVGPRLKAYHLALSPISVRGLLLRMLPQLGAFGAFLVATDGIFGAESGLFPAWLPAAWLALAVLVAVLALRLVARIGFWTGFARQETGAMIMAGAVAIASLTIAMASQQLWEPLSDLTFAVSAQLLGLMYSDIYADPLLRILGTDTFRVSIDTACSGYEGIGLVVVFTAFVLSLFRADFRFPQALLLFPIGIAAIWSFNAIRIALLIGIGHELSPEIAVGGFHSQAGWISFVLVAVGLLAGAYRISFFRADTPVPTRSAVVTAGLNANVAYLLPIVALLGSTLLTLAFTADMDWLYPLRVVMVGAVLALAWRHFRFVWAPVSWVAVGGGFLVLALWLALVPTDPAQDALVGAKIGEAPLWIAALWIIFRCVGSAVTVPLAEELAFRGYLMARLTPGEPSPADRLPFSWLALLVSSAVFGLLHGAWLAGAIAGLTYGLIRYHRGRVADAVVAHAVTNALLSVYVLVTGHWSLW
jgi:exosortase E/protease (VPEID-CTERM system)